MVEGPLAESIPARIQEQGLATIRGPRPAPLGDRPASQRRRLHRTAGERAWSCGPSRSPPRSTSSGARLDRHPPGPGRRGVPPGAGARPRHPFTPRVPVCPRYEGVDERIRVDGRSRALDRRLRPDRRRARGTRGRRRGHPPSAGRDRGGFDRRGVLRCRPARVSAVHPAGDVRRERRSRGARERRSRRGQALAFAGGASADACPAAGPARRTGALAGRSATCWPRSSRRNRWQRRS